MRGAPRLVATSDVTRFRGLAVAAAVGAVVAAIATIVMWPRAPSPGALSASHRNARIGCATCHTRGTDEAPPSSACASCHGTHATARAGHASLRTSGALSCASCHGGHRGHGTVTFFPDGTARRRDDLGDRTVASHFRPARAITVPLLDANRCARCHDATRAPLATCTTNGQVTCFDEHAPIRASNGDLAARAAAWDAAREVAHDAPPRPRPARRSAQPWLVVALASIAALLAWAAARTLASVARHPSPAARHPSPASRLPPPASRLPSPASRLPPPATATAAATAAAAATATATASAITRRLPVISAATCLGCNACVEACPYDVLEVHRYVAVVARPDACCGLTLCAQICPNQSLTMRDVDAGADAGASSPFARPGRNGLESPDAPGIFVVGDAGGGSLIRNAVDEGARAIATIASRPRPAVRDADLLDVVIIGAGPAGLAAALEARARDLRAITLEQGSIASSIQSFPRGKLVLDAAPPGAAPPRLWLAEATKEELLARWTLAVRTEQPPLLEHRRVTAIDRAPDGTWRVSSTATSAATDDTAASAPLTHRARAVVLAIGRRGSPRRLAVDIPPTMTAHVHYALADAASFAGRRVLVVGAGDVAMETAIALSRQPGTTVTLSYRGTDLRRGRARNIAELRRRIAAGAVRAIWSSEVTAITSGPASAATLATPGGPVHVGCDSVFVLIGSAAAPAGDDLLSRLTRDLRATQTEPPHHAFDTR